MLFHIFASLYLAYNLVFFVCTLFGGWMVGVDQPTTLSLPTQDQEELVSNEKVGHFVNNEYGLKTFAVVCHVLTFFLTFFSFYNSDSYLTLLVHSEL